MRPASVRLARRVFSRTPPPSALVPYSRTLCSQSHYPVLNDHAAPTTRASSTSPQALAAKRAPPRIPELYDALVNPSAPRTRFSPDRSKTRPDAPDDPYAAAGATLARSQPVSIPPLRAELNEALLKRLRSAVAAQNSKAATAVIDEIVQAGVTPSPRAIMLATEACVREGALGAVIPLHKAHLPPPRLNADISCAARAARATLGLALCSRGAFENAIEAMGVQDVETFSCLQGNALEESVAMLGLGNSALAWGVLIRALSRAGPPRTAVQVSELAMKNAVAVSDGLLHSMIDALRRAGMWEQAGALFDQAVEKGLQPHERTIGAALIALTGKRARGNVEVRRVEKVVDMAENPSMRFQPVALMALSAVGSVERAERIFVDIADGSENGIPSEFSYSCMMAAYSNSVELLGTDVDDAVRRRIFEDVSAKADQLWAQYIKAYRLHRPKGGEKQERETMLSKYLMVKSRCFHAEDAVKVLEELAERRDMYPYMEARASHFAVVLGALELSCDVTRLERLTKLMAELDIRHDMRSMAFCVGAYVGDGDLTKALGIVRTHASAVLASGRMHGGFREYFPVMLLRRLKTLSNALEEAGTGKVPDIAVIIAEVEKLRVEAAVMSKRKERNAAA